MSRVRFVFRPWDTWTDPETSEHQRRSSWSFRATQEQTIRELADELDRLDATEAGHPTRRRGRDADPPRRDAPRRPPTLAPRRASQQRYKQRLRLQEARDLLDRNQP